MDTPLLAPDDGDTPPSLSSGPIAHEGSENEGLLSRLSGRSDTDVPIQNEQHQQQQRQQPVTLREENPVKAALFVIATGSLTLLHAGFVWGSYLVSSWSDVYVIVKVSWLDSTAEALVQSMDMGTLMSVFFQAKQYLHVILLAFAGLVLPVLAMVVHSVRLIQDQIKLPYPQQSRRPFQWLELGLRFSLFVVYVMSVLDFSTTFELQWTGTNIAVANRWRGGLVAFVGGTSASMLVVTLFRIRDSLVWKHQARSDASYRLIESDGSQEGTQRRRRRILAWEFGLMALILLVPSLTLPLMRISYSGLAANFMASSSESLYLWKIPFLVWQNGLRAGTQTYMLAVVVAASVFHVVLAPLTALAVGLDMWRREETKNAASKSRRRLVLHSLHPHVNSITFSFAVLCTGLSLSRVAHVLLDHDAYGVCEKMNDLVGETCLDLSGQLLWGGWFCLAQAFMLEVFISITLSAFRE